MTGAFILGVDVEFCLYIFIPAKPSLFSLFFYSLVHLRQKCRGAVLRTINVDLGIERLKVVKKGLCDIVGLVRDWREGPI